MDNRWQCIVVGAGIQGSWTAYQLVKRGYKTLLLEQFRLPHSRGSSHGQTRIIRNAYQEDFQTALMLHTYTLWRDLEREQNTQLIYPVGLFCVASTAGRKNLNSVKKSLGNNPAIQYQELSASDIRKKYPQVKYSDDHSALLEIGAGIMRADKALNTVQNAFRQQGGVIRDGFKVTSITPGKRVVITGESGEELICDHLVLCPGPWASKLLKQIDLDPPLQPWAVPVFYFKVKGPDQCLPHAFMDFDKNRGTQHGFGMPCFEYPGMVKMGWHGGTPVDPDDRDGGANKKDLAELADFTCEYIRKHFPGIEPKPAINEMCMYTITPDEMCILDRHPLHSNIALGCGFSGTGFKMGPIVGEILADLVTGRSPIHDIKSFSLDRFNSPSKL